MTTDPMLYILSSAILGAAIGFIGCALYAARRVRETQDEAYHEGYTACNRAHQNSRQITQAVRSSLSNLQEERRIAHAETLAELKSCSLQLEEQLQAIDQEILEKAAPPASPPAPSGHAGSLPEPPAFPPHPESYPSLQSVAPKSPGLSSAHLTKPTPTEQALTA